MESNKAIVREFIERVINGGEFEAAGEFMWEDVIERVPFPGQGERIEGVKDILRGMAKAFGWIWIVEEQIAEGEKVVTRFVWTGTHQGDFMGIAATGETVRVWGMVVDRFEGGRIRETRIIMDSLGLMMQLGVMPGGPG